MKPVDFILVTKLVDRVKGILEKYEVLKGVSRSFFLTLRVLPAPMRRGASVGYLLARTSDTLADTASLSTGVRLEWLMKFKNAVASRSEPPRWPVSLLNAVCDPRERLLLECSGDVFEQLRALPSAEGALVQEVLEVILSGQTMDLEQFSGASRENPVVLADSLALEDYAWRVAGCVGEFWTKLGFLTLGDQFSLTPEPELIEKGVRYGKGLQLINILRDLPADLAAGRCYLPVGNPQDRRELMHSHAEWLETAEQWIVEGEVYARHLKSLRLRVGSVLPALLARETAKLLREISWEDLQMRPKISRRQVYACLARAMFL